MAKQKQKATRNAPGTEFTFEVLILQSIFEIGALDDRFEIVARTPPTVIGEVDPALVPVSMTTMGTAPVVETNEISLNDFENILDDVNGAVVPYTIEGRINWTDAVSYVQVTGDIPADQAKDLTPFTVWGKPTYGVDPDAECTSRPAFGLLYPRRAT